MFCENLLMEKSIYAPVFNVSVDYVNVSVDYFMTSDVGSVFSKFVHDKPVEDLSENQMCTVFMISLFPCNWLRFFEAKKILNESFRCQPNVNPLRAKFFREIINIYLHFMSFLHINKAQVVEIPPSVRQGSAYFT